MKYKFRLVFFHSRPGFFRIDKKLLDYSLSEGLVLQVFPRDADTLLGASKYHIDCGGVSSLKDAQNCGEKLRTHLRMLNCIFDLGLSIPCFDGKSGNVSEGIKEQVRKSGGKLLDTITGLLAYPDDSKHFEHVLSGEMRVFPSEPLYVLKGLKDSWGNTFELNERVAEVLEILNIAVREISPKVKYLTTYLAVEQLIERKMRSNHAQKLIDNFVELTNKSELLEVEKKSLSGSSRCLKEQSFSSAFTSYAKCITSPETINEIPVAKFVSECIKLRNKIAHNAAIESMPNIGEYTKQLRSMALAILWTENDFPSFSVNRPSDQIEMEKMEVRML